MAIPAERVEDTVSSANEPERGSSAKIFQDFERIRNINGPLENQERSTFYEHVIDALKNVPGGTYCEDVAGVYKSITGGIFLRREHPIKAFDTILNNVPLRIHSDNAELNATRWHGTDDVNSLHNPFIEGFSHVEGLVTVLGFTQGKGLRKLDASRLNEDMKEKGVVIDRDVSIDGVVQPNELVFMVVRLPAQFVPDQQLSSAEQEAKEDGRLKFVFRGVLLNTEASETEAVH